METTPPPIEPVATLVISTKNRLHDLRNAVESALNQSVPIEVLVMDDGSSDGTADDIRSRFPAAVVHRTETSSGYIVKRNLGARLARGPVIFSIDDDAAFASSETVRQTLEEFDDDRIGAVAIPFVNVKYGPELRTAAPDREQKWITDCFVGTSYAVRRDVFLELEGFCAPYYHQVEEQDFCAKLLDSGRFVRLGNADPIHHFESPIRDLTRIRTHNARNNILFTWQHVPASRLPLHWAGNVVNLVKHGVRTSSLAANCEGLIRGFGCVIAGKVNRRPLKLNAYHLHRRLKAGPISLEEAACITQL